MSEFTFDEKQKMLYLVKVNQRSYDYVARMFNTDRETVRSIVYELYSPDSQRRCITRGITICGKPKPNKEPVPFVRYKGDKVLRFGVISDTHIGSIYTQLTHLHNFYDICAEEGITEVYHAGDIDEGDQMRAGHQYECYVQGVDQHVEEIVKNYPIRDGIRTFFITGNHDYSIYRRNGCDIGKLISAQRDDLIYLGQDIARVELSPNCTMELRHPYDGGNSSISCKVQKLVDGMYKDPPSILVVGNYHKVEQLYYKGVHVLQSGAFQGETKFTKTKNLRVDAGGWIITVVLDDDGNIKRFIPELIPYPTDIENDWKNWR